MRRWSRWGSPVAWRDDRGSASLEFITTGLILLVPLVYLMLTVSSIQGGALAVEAASRQAARVFVQARSIDEAEERVELAVAFALADYGLDGDDVAVTVSCSPNANRCLTRRGFVTVTVQSRVALPLVPSVLDLDTPLSVPLSAEATQQVSRFWGAQ
jgi:hypothetical protein